MNNTSKRAGIVAAVLLAAGLTGACPGTAFADTSVSTAVTHHVDPDGMRHDQRVDNDRDHGRRYDNDRRRDNDRRYDNDRRRYDNDWFIGDRGDRVHHYPVDPRPRNGWWHH